MVSTISRKYRKSPLLLVLALLIAAILVYAFIDGGRETPHLIEQDLSGSLGTKGTAA